MNTLVHMGVGIVTFRYGWLRVVTCCYIFRGENVCQSWFQVPILYSFPTHEYLVTYLHWAYYVLLRVVTRCYLLLIFRGENVCQSTFQVPISYSFPTHEYLVAYVHWACYVLFRVVTCCYIFTGAMFVKVISRLTFYIRFQPTNTLLHTFIGLVTCCYAWLPVVTSLEGQSLSKYFPGLHFIFVSNPRIPCCIRSLGLLRVVTRCYLLLHP